MSNLSKLNYLPLLWNYPDRRLFDNKHLEEEEWQSIEVRWPEKLNWQKASSGLMFLTHREFGEWMSENKYSMSAAIDTLTLNPLPWLHEMDFTSSTYFSARSCGKYRYCKIGFRICYSD